MVKGSANDVAYLVRQGQQEVIEEDGGSRGYIILVVISRSQEQEWYKPMPTFLEVLGGIGVQRSRKSTHGRDT